jgi:predicted RND superfamily exporter protein
MNDMRTQFGADMIYLLVHAEEPIIDVREPAFLAYINDLSQKLRTHENILEVRSLVDQVLLENEGSIPHTLETTNQLLKENPQTEQFVNDEYDFTVIYIRSDTGASAALIKQLAKDIEYDIASLEDTNPGANIQMTGFNVIDKATFEVIMSDFAIITLVSMILIALVVFITFRSLVKGMLPMIVVMTALIWTMGIAGYANLTITVVSMVSAAMIMGLGIDFGIHIVHTYFERRKKLNKEKALEETLRELTRANTGASLTTAAGFLALLFGVLPAMKTLAIILAVGIISTLIGATFLLPVVTYLYDTHIQRNKRGF